MRNKILIVGAGITGITLAEKYASLRDHVYLVEKRNHIGGNCYDFENKDGILIHKYGPHIFHTNYKEVWDYLSQFTDWLDYQHKVLGFIDGEFVPIPFNLNTLHKLLPNKKARILEKKLLEKLGYNKKISVLELKRIKDKNLKFLADFVYEKIFLHYTEKQWSLKPEEISPEVTGRVSIIISKDNRYFQDKYQGIPKKGYSKMFKKMLNNKNIKIILKTDFKKIKEKNEYDLLFYTGPIDEFFDYKFGKLSYRCLKINLQALNQESFQPAAVVNYPSLKYSFTRITEFKKLTQQKNKRTIIGKEFPGEKGFTAWPILENKNIKIFQEYWRMAENLKKQNIYFVGRLAEYKYYDMDDAVKNVLSLFDKINHAKK
jgi:UDP-galactopyranose mutase